MKEAQLSNEMNQHFVSKWKASFNKAFNRLELQCGDVVSLTFDQHEERPKEYIELEKAVLQRAAFLHNMSLRKRFCCSFCHKDSSKVDYLVIADPICICGECAISARNTIRDAMPSGTKLHPSGEKDG